MRPLHVIAAIFGAIAPWLIFGRFFSTQGFCIPGVAAGWMVLALWLREPRLATRPGPAA